MTDLTHEQGFRYISEILRSIRSTNQHEKVLHLIVDRIVRMYKCQTCAIVLIDPSTEYLRIDNCYGLSLTFCNAFRRHIATAAIGQLLWTGKPIFIGNATDQQSLADEVKMEQPFASCLAVQMGIDQRTLGYLYVDSRETFAFSEDQIQLLQMFADLSALAIVKSRLYEENLRLERVDKESGLEKYVPFLEKVQRSMDRAKDFNENFSVMILDIDNFKFTMNTYGYDSSRQLLKEMGDRIRGHLRTIDAAGRYGFDEFIILLANTGLDGALSSAKLLRKTIEETVFTKHRIGSTVSIGVAAYPQNGRTIEDIILSAKNALFEAQRAGRNNVFCCTEERLPVDVMRD